MAEYNLGELLGKIDSPFDLKKLSVSQLPQLSDEVRQYMIDVLSEIGNSHFAASLGVIELTVALHYVFDTPIDQLVWDVGHQAYGHKILTGRRDVFPTNRKKGGISGFPKRSESEYDTFGVGHSSTSISAALGMAIANRYKGNFNHHHIAVIGDGAMTSGLAFEGLNHAGFEKDANLLIVLNDNCMSIDPDVGALRDYLNKITTSQYKEKGDDEAWEILSELSKFGKDAAELVKNVEKLLKDKLKRQINLFEALNFRYFGPIDGHNVIALTEKLEELKNIPGPKILHCITKKGKGFKFAEEGNPAEWHAPGAFNKLTGEIVKSLSKSPLPPKYQDVFGYTIVELAEKNKNIIGITPAMPSGTSLNVMMEAMPNRTFDVGIAEQHAVTFAAGLSTLGMVPFCAIYSTFMQRAYDQIIHDVALQNLNVVFCLDRAGIVGADGPTHHGVFDLAFMRSIPNMTVSAPMNESELRNLMFTAQQENKGPFSIRYPRGKGVLVDWKTPMELIKVGTGREITSGNDIAILSIGHPGNFVQEAILELNKSGFSIAHYDIRFVKPIDEDLLHKVFSKFDKIITVEDGCLMGGMGSAVIEFMCDHNYTANVKRLGVPDEFLSHGTPAELYAESGFDVEGISNAVRVMLGEE